MQLFRFNPTIRETNKYLNNTVELLLKKHRGVSDEEFEKELTALTGIGWKQVKNYKNHPKPSQRIKDNSVVVKFVFDCRRRDTGRKMRHVAGITFVAVGILFSVYKIAMRPRTIEQFVVHEQVYDSSIGKKIETKVFLELPDRDWVLRVGSLDHSKVPLDKFSCSRLPASPLTNCNYSDGIGNNQIKVVLILDDKFVRRFTLIAFEPKLISALRNQLAERVNADLAREPASTGSVLTQQFKIGDESISIQSSPSAPNMRQMLSVMVSL